MTTVMPSQADRSAPTDRQDDPSRPEQPAPSTAPIQPPIQAQLKLLADFLRSVNWREPRTAWRQIVEQFGLTKLIVAGTVVVLVLTAFVLPGGQSSDPFDGPGAALDLVLKLGAVLALAYVSMAALKRYTAGSVSQRGTLLEVLDSTVLGPNRSVYVVRAGEKRLILGVTQNQITSLGEFAEEPAAPQPLPSANMAAPHPYDVRAL